MGEISRIPLWEQMKLVREALLEQSKDLSNDSKLVQRVDLPKTVSEWMNVSDDFVRQN